MYMQSPLRFVIDDCRYDKIISDRMDGHLCIYLFILYAIVIINAYILIIWYVYYCTLQIIYRLKQWRRKFAKPGGAIFPVFMVKN